MNLLYFHLEVDFNDPISLISNNQMDLENHLVKLGFWGISFSDIDKYYGTCTVNTQYGREIAKCYYIKKI